MAQPHCADLASQSGRFLCRFGWPRDEFQKFKRLSHRALAHAAPADFAKKPAARDTFVVATGGGKMNEPDRFLFGAATWTGNAGDRH
jgi:hypothetical protein